jgi:hypothetical protein
MARKKSTAKLYDRWETGQGRYVEYDREAFLTICCRLLRGDNMKDICAKPPMPPALLVAQWVQTHPEARAIFQCAGAFDLERRLGKEAGEPYPLGLSDWLQEVRARLELGHALDYVERKTFAIDWNKVYALAGPPALLLGENRQAYDNLLDLCAQRIDPRDPMELIPTKRAADALWELRRLDCEKSRTPVRTLKYEKELEAAQLRTMRRYNSAVRQIEDLRKALGGKVQALSCEFLLPQPVERHERISPVFSDAQTQDTIGEGVAVAPSLLPSVELVKSGRAINSVHAQTDDVAAVARAADVDAQTDDIGAVARAADVDAQADDIAAVARAADVDAQADDVGAVARAADVDAQADDVGAVARAADVDTQPNDVVAVACAADVDGQADDAAAVALAADTTDRADAAVAVAVAAAVARKAAAAFTSGAAPSLSPSNGVDWVSWLTGTKVYGWRVLQQAARESFKRDYSSKQGLVRTLMTEHKMVRPEQVCAELAPFVPASVKAAPPPTASSQEPKTGAPGERPHSSQALGGAGNRQNEPKETLSVRPAPLGSAATDASVSRSSQPFSVFGRTNPILRQPMTRKMCGHFPQIPTAT